MNPRCSLCPGTSRQIPPFGATPSKFLIIGDSPDYRSEKLERPFSGPAGQELIETYLGLAGIDRSECYFTTAVQCRQTKEGQDVRSSEKLIECCAVNHLGREFATSQPQIIITNGAGVSGLFKGINLDLEHGIPRKLERSSCLGDWTGWLVPMYSPAAGMKDGRFMIQLLEDWEKFGLWLRGKHTYPVGDAGPLDYSEIKGWRDIQRLMKLATRWNGWVNIDSESDEGRQYSYQVSFSAGRAGMAFVTSIAVMDELRSVINTDCEGATMHNAAYDLEEMDEVGIRPRQIRDTQQELYHLGHLPQGLKAAVYRVFGFRMTSYDETVTPYSKELLNEWLAEALAVASMELQTTIPHPPGPDCPTCGKKHRLDVSKNKPHECEAVLRRVMGKLDDADANDYDPWQPPKWEKGVEKPRLLGREWLEELESRIGRMPRKSIIHAPYAQQIAYGCGDADWTGRLATWLEAERARIVEKEWKVA